MIADPSTPLALIDSVSYFNAEQEVLFSLHTVFHVSEIKKIEKNNRFYQVTLILTSDNDQELQILTQRIREETSPRTQEWYRIGELLLKLDQFDKAEQVYSTVLQQTPSAKDQADIYYQFGCIKNNQGHYEKAISFYERTIEIDRKSVSINFCH
ncbi:unnamed protein product [Rotaria sp. Silwood1]|nr:unnamed protein product [Rotaria sp. Silwood1]CAF3600840.1 unnamed protein product [Rotaria sp. Silwood1]CAF3605229.1 unnamed protein product [Rotaria sp. Silwood1]CAF4776557.1 unnamed protein product [Rotaria sp. Silwood1]CAF4852182.1 unnamed protein product [Rotaria sp. Silwood1]